MQVAWPEFFLGAATMFLLDPNLGGKRRSGLRTGFVGSMRWAFHQPVTRLVRFPKLRFRRRAAELTDAEVMERIRGGVATLSHPDCIDVKIESRRVTLSGPILAREVVGLIKQIAHVPGVLGVNNRLRVRRISEHVPEWDSVRGGRRRLRSRAEKSSFGT